MSFLQQVLHGEKFLLPKEDVVISHWPRYREFTVKQLWINVGDDDKILGFLPDRNSSSKDLNREWGYNVLWTLKPGFCKKILEHACEQRANSFRSKLNPDVVNIKDELLSALTSFPIKKVSLLSS
jgi:hypothetical protein